MSRESLHGKTALVTGAARRIGREIALALARADVNVAAHFRRLGVPVVGFLTYEVSGRAAEITWMAVRNDRRRVGVGRSLIESLTGRLVSAGTRLLAAKTLSDRNGPYGPYEETRRFYLSMGFRPAAELDIWGPDNPAVLLTLPLL